MARHRYLVDGEICEVPHDRCPNCWAGWSFKIGTPDTPPEALECPCCGYGLGEQIKLMLDSDVCPHCEKARCRWRIRHAISAACPSIPRLSRGDERRYHRTTSSRPALVWDWSRVFSRRHPRVSNDPAYVVEPAIVVTKKQTANRTLYRHGKEITNQTKDT